MQTPTQLLKVYLAQIAFLVFHQRLLQKVAVAVELVMEIAVHMQVQVADHQVALMVRLIHPQLQHNLDKTMVMETLVQLDLMVLLRLTGLVAVAVVLVVRALQEIQMAPQVLVVLEN